MANVDVLTSPSNMSYHHTHSCLLLLLQPVRHILHNFLSASDAAHFMQASRSTTAALLADYRFVDHVFYLNTVADVQHTHSFYARYRMRILRLCLTHHQTDSLVDSETGRSLLFPSLTALSFGNDCGGGSVAHAAFDGSGRKWNEEDESDEYEHGEQQLSRRLQRWEESNSWDTWNVFRYSESYGDSNHPVLPAALPHGLRFLQFNYAFNQPLQQGSIPDTVEVLKFGADFNQQLEVGHLPASLTHLTFGRIYNQPLLPGVLPATLQRLHLGGCYNQPLLPDTLPAQLQQLCIADEYSHPIRPGVIPTSVTHLRLPAEVNHSLQRGSIPEGVVHLNLGHAFNHPLLPGVLPTSLRELVITHYYNQPLQPGSLPDGLAVLTFLPQSVFQQPLQPGVIPASVTVVSLGREYSVGLVAGGIPATVRWLRLPASYSSHDVSRVLSPSTRVVFWRE